MSVKKRAAAERYWAERHRELNKLRRIFRSSGSAAMMGWAAEHSCLDLAKKILPR